MTYWTTRPLLCRGYKDNAGRPKLSDIHCHFQDLSASQMAICQFFLKGACKFSNNCRNAHPEGPFGNYTPYQTRRFRKMHEDLAARAKCARLDWPEEDTSHLTEPGVWPASVSKEFDSIPPHAQEADLYSPYHALLSTIFPATSGFSIVGHRPLILNFYVYVYEVYLANQPVFILLLNAETMLFSTSTREGVDSQLRQHLKYLLAKSSVSILHGACAFGRRLAFYYGNKSAIIPPVGTDDPLDTAPVDRWDCDVLVPDGAEHLKALATEINMRHGITSI